MSLLMTDVRKHLYTFQHLPTICYQSHKISSNHHTTSKLFFHVLDISRTVQPKRSSNKTSPFVHVKNLRLKLCSADQFAAVYLAEVAGQARHLSWLELQDTDQNTLTKM